MDSPSPAPLGQHRFSAASAASFRSDELLAIKTAKRGQRTTPSPLSLSALSTHAAFDESDLRPPSLVSDRTSTVSSTTSPRLSLALPSPFPLLPLLPPPKFQPYAHDVFGDDSESVFEQRNYAAPSPVLLRSGFAGARAVSSSTAAGVDGGEEKRREDRRRKHHSVVPVKGVTTPHGTPRTDRFPDLHRPLPPLPPGLERPAPAGERPARPRTKGKNKNKDKARVHRSNTRSAPLDPAPAPPLPPTPVTPYAGVAHSPTPVERERERQQTGATTRPWVARVYRVCRRARFRRLRQRWRLVWGRAED